jgi:uncharacterized protein
MIQSKKIAIIGGGASGLISGYLLSHKYNITIYEKAPILGGNIRTINKNVLGTNLPAHLNIENGVLGFSQNYYPKFHDLLRELNVPYHSFKPSVSLFSGGDFFPARAKSYLHSGIFKKLLFQSDYREKVWRLLQTQKAFKRNMSATHSPGPNFEDYNIMEGLYKDYLQALFMLSFSTPHTLVPNLPQSVLNPYLNTLPNSTWSFVKGGVYSYIEAILSKSSMRIICNANGVQVSRLADSVQVHFLGEVHNYDAVVIATTPGSIKALLRDMNDHEQSLFSGMNDQSFKTTAHSDLSFYGPFKQINKTPMDLFLNYNDIGHGYNTYQNQVYRLKTNNHYSFAYNLDDAIAKEAIINEVNHTVPKYSKNHDIQINQIKAINGQNRTFYAGAYLGNGLHEGAVVSAINVVLKLGGLLL